MEKKQTQRRPNPVAKYGARFQRAAAFRDRTKYRRHPKHRGREPFPAGYLKTLGRKGLASLLFVAGLIVPGLAPAGPGGNTMQTIDIHSAAFAPGAEIPSLYTCQGKDISPPLEWQSVPPQARALVLIADDPDAPDPAAPRMTWVHWVLYDLPAETRGLPEAVIALPEGTREGLNDWHRTGYGGPCPPIGRHRYFFKLYALDQPLGDLGTPTKEQVLKAMQGHVIAEGQLIGTYQKH